MPLSAIAALLLLPPAVREWRDLPYAAAHPRQVLDVHAPEGARGAPVVVFLHGGGWSRGDKRQALRGKQRAFPAAGFVLVSANYRLSPEHPYPAFVQDAAAAVGWVRANIGRFGGDPGRLFVMGHSAGAHLAACLGADPRWLRPHGLRPADLLGVVSLDGGGMDVAESARFPATAAIYRRAFGDDPEVWEEASPIVQARKADRLPDFLLVVAGKGLMGQARRDRRSQRQAERFAEVARSKGARAETSLWPELDHGGVNDAAGQADHPLCRKIVAWMRERTQPDQRR
ncbi:MAG: alpha/beta hydrolase [Fimbriimonadales bacterium]|nr:alpha/beta hydrolase [Fimbriimonadales bacterium]